MKLLIVESPTKCKTLSRFLGKDYCLAASMGHIRDLPQKELGIDVERDFAPRYVIIPGRQKVINALKKSSAKAEQVYLSTDPDREGEAIAWHLAQLLGLNGAKPYQRIVFHEITESAIKEALRHPRKIDLNLVDAQQARRVLDRLVGYRLSPFLWKKIARGLSAGRVQSVAVRLVCAREKEIENFKTEEFWTIVASLQKKNLKKSRGVEKFKFFEAALVKKEGKVIPKFGIKIKEEADKIVKNLQGAEYKVADIEKKEVKRNPLPPFITSTLQQEAWKKFKFPAKLTMRTAQQLYEQGLCTYHRTDSLNLSGMSLFAAKKFIVENYGQDHWAGFLRKYKTKSKTAQEAHEAIRPTYADRDPQTLKAKAKLDERQFKLYDLIWRRFIASQMAQAVFDSTVVDIEAGKYGFRSAGQILKFDGFLKVYPLKHEETELPALEKGEVLNLVKLNPCQHFTQPPPRYSEASLIRALEENGIGRPSTYAPILSTIQARNYIEKNQKKQFQPTEIGLVVNNLLAEHFSQVVDIKFTAEMEEDLDKIARGKKKWVPTVQEFYSPFMENLNKKTKEINKMVMQTDEKCQKCGKPMVVRLGKYGKFLGCSGFPECKNIKNIEKGLGLPCPKCVQGEVVEKRTRTGKKFWGCNRWPDCDFATWQNPREEKKEERTTEAQ